MEQKSIDFLFFPKSVAFVGISSDPSNPLRDMFLKPMRNIDFKGPLYLINPKGGDIEGIQVYPSLESVPGQVDFVIATLPSNYSLQLIEECIKKGVKAVHFFTAGFSETGNKDEIELEKKLAKKAREGGVRIVGPNSMGVYCPKGGISYWADFPKTPGNVGYISQSGGNSIHLVQMASARGIHFSKVVSYGNACDLNECDYIEYLADDPDTEIIAVYIEGVREGKRFIDILTKAAKKKPVILLKGGVSEAGIRAVASHTGSLSGSNSTWDALCNQLGVIRVNSLEELTDMLVIFHFMTVPIGRNVGVVGIGGGASVLSTDECERNNLYVPPLSKEISDKIMEFTPHVGNIIKNPIDSQLMFRDPGLFVETVRIVSDWEEIDLIIALLMSTDVFPSFGETSMYGLLVDTMLNSCKVSSKPIAVMIQPGIRPEMTKEAFEAQQKFVSMGFPVFHSVSHAANAVNKFINFWRWKEKRKI
ncbi:MAG: CoA-binding protein [Spirochaetota bacterium]|nr:CoA-binding protein [Spirochaetota bacterium]